VPIHQSNQLELGVCSPNLRNGCFGNRVSNSRGSRNGRVMMTSTAGNYIKPKPSELWNDDDFNWYILQTQNSFEDWCVKTIWQKLENMELQDQVEEMVVPKQKVAKMTGKSTKIIDKALYPTYVYIKMKMSEELWDALVHTPRVVNFVGYDQGVLNRGGTGYTGKRGVVIPAQLSEREVAGLQKNLERYAQMEEELQAVAELELGDIVQIQNNGDLFDNEIGAVRAIKDNEIIVRISNYGRPIEYPCAANEVRKLSDQEIIEDNMRREAEREGRHVNEIKRKYGMNVPLAEDEAIYFDSPKKIVQIPGYVSSSSLYHRRNQVDGTTTRRATQRNVKEIRLSSADTTDELQFENDDAFFSSLDDLLGDNYNDDVTADLDLDTPTKLEKSAEASDDETLFSTLLDGVGNSNINVAESSEGGDFLAELDGILDQGGFAAADESTGELDLSFADGLDSELSSAAVQRVLEEFGDSDFSEVSSSKAVSKPAQQANPDLENIDLDNIEDEELAELMKSLNNDDFSKIDFENGPSADELQSLDKELENLEVDETELAEILSSLGEDFARNMVGGSQGAADSTSVGDLEFQELNGAELDALDATFGVPLEHQRPAKVNGEDLEIEEGLNLMHLEDSLPSEENQSKEEMLEEISKMKVPELKAALKSRGLKVGGKKAELVERLREAMDLL